MFLAFMKVFKKEVSRITISKKHVIHHKESCDFDANVKSYCGLL